MIDILGVNKLNGVRTRGRLVLVDLAGSERLDKSGAVGSRMKEAQNINKYGQGGEGRVATVGVQSGRAVDAEGCVFVHAQVRAGGGGGPCTSMGCPGGRLGHGMRK
jgi:hypothetical protein